MLTRQHSRHSVGTDYYQSTQKAWWQTAISGIWMAAVTHSEATFTYPLLSYLCLCSHMWCPKACQSSARCKRVEQAFKVIIISYIPSLRLAWVNLTLRCPSLGWWNNSVVRCLPRGPRLNPNTEKQKKLDYLCAQKQHVCVHACILCSAGVQTPCLIYG